MSEQAKAGSPRTAICTECRVLLRAGEMCDGGARHRVVALDSEDGRAALAEEVWKTPRLHRVVTPEARLVASGLLVTAVFAPAMAVSPVIGVLVGASAVHFSKRLMSARRGKQLPYGTPASVLLPESQLRRPLHGRIAATASVRAPLSGRLCVGYAVIMRSDEFLGGDVMLADSAIAECEVALDDGRMLSVPAGRIRLEVADLDRIGDLDRIHDFLAAIDPALPTAQLCVPFDHVWEGVLEAGDQVAITGETTDLPLSYRESGSKLLLRTVPRIRVLARAGSSEVRP
ncbi:MAG: hypothetical protein AAGC55_10380 [Myxococcota bacterium]